MTTLKRIASGELHASELNAGERCRIHVDTLDVGELTLSLFDSFTPGGYTVQVYGEGLPTGVEIFATFYGLAPARAYRRRLLACTSWEGMKRVPDTL